MSEILNTGIKLWSIKDDYDELQTKIFEELTGSTGKSNMRIISELIEDNKSNIQKNTVDISNNTKKITEHEMAISTLNGEGQGSVKQTVSDGIAEIVADAPESFDTLKEISDWISNHENDASAMNSAIQTNKTDIASLKTDKVDKETGKSLLVDTDKVNYDDAVSKAHKHNNKSVLDKISETNGNLTYDGNEIKAAQMIGATSTTNGTSGTVPAPKAGQENLFLRGDGTWADLSSYYNNANYSDNKLQLMHNDTILKEFEIKSGGTSIAPKATVEPSIVSGNAKVTITWGDPDDSIIDGIVLSTWKGTKLVMKENGYPENENDGTVILDNTEKDKYKTTGYEVTGLINGNTYYFALFPYSTDGIYNYSETGRLLGKPSLVKLDPCTDMKATATMGKVTVTWTDPNATKTENGNTATWQKTVLVYKQGTTAPTDINDGTIAVEEMTRNQYQNTGYEATSLIDGNDYSFSLFAISTDSAVSDATSVSAKLYATLTVTTEEVSLYGKAVTVTSDGQTVTGTFSNSGSVTLRIPWMGNTTISATDGTDTTTATVNIAEYGKSYNTELSFLKIVTFADGTDDEIAAMIQAHYDNKINIADYWAVGDKRSVNLSAMSATYVGESHRAQTVQFAIADFEKDELSAAINGHAKAAITLTQVDCLMDATNASNPVNGSSNSENGYMNSSNTNAGGWTDCARRTWCNNVYFNALPSTLRNTVKAVNKKTSAGSQSSTINTTTDKVFLLAEVEIFGTTTYSVSGEGTQYQYYKNATANRYKMPKWSSSSSSHIYWERSPYSGNSSAFCRVNSGGNASCYDASSTYGCAPCLCI